MGKKEDSRNQWGYSHGGKVNESSFQMNTMSWITWSSAVSQHPGDSRSYMYFHTRIELMMILVEWACIRLIMTLGSMGRCGNESSFQMITMSWITWASAVSICKTTFSSFLFWKKNRFHLRNPGGVHTHV
jgi:hypothetical protein